MGDISGSNVVFLPHNNRCYYWYCLLHTALYKGTKASCVALGLMLGGAIGNFIDRAVRQEVVDFIHVIIVNYNYPIFNIADSSLCVGVMLLFIQMLLDSGKKKKEQ